MNTRFARFSPARFAIACLALFACNHDTSNKTATDTNAVPVAATKPKVDLTGAGATFPYPLYSRWFNDYAQRTNVRINYQSIGSGGGIRQVLAETVDFGATDVPMSDQEIAAAPKGKLIHIPTVLGAVAITYNLPQLTRPLQLSGEVIAQIFLGKINRWNDARIKALNPDATLPAKEILVVHRADGSGTSYILSDFLTSASTDWANGPGRGKDVKWPAGIGGKGNEGVAGQVKQMDGAIGYLEVVYARQNYLPVAHIQNRAGKFTAPQPFEISSAAASITDSLSSDSDLRVSLVNAPGADSYPIASFTWMLIAPGSIGAEKTKELVAFLRWALKDGGVMAAELGYVPLPAATAARVLQRLDALATP
ncbi:MAG: phosphate ABC transporter substrate-binding protein PstS [Gemmatimonadaceae bacterium]